MGSRRQHRRSLRLREHDYGQAGAYFVTLVVQQRECLFGEVVDAQVQLNDLGRIVEEECLRTATARPSVAMSRDDFVVMPNHVHAIIWILDSDRRGEAVPRSSAATPSIRGARHRLAPTGAARGSLGAIIGQLKSVTTKRINRVRESPGAAVWQRNYYEHIIRDDWDLTRIRQYIAANPARWTEDPENPVVSALGMPGPSA